MTAYLIQFYTRDGRLWSWQRVGTNGTENGAAESAFAELPTQDYLPVVVTVGYIH
jgi:hypothetical protein